jgi:hypothetical protein
LAITDTAHSFDLVSALSGAAAVPLAPSSLTGWYHPAALLRCMSPLMAHRVIRCRGNTLGRNRGYSGHATKPCGEAVRHMTRSGR